MSYCDVLIFVEDPGAANCVAALPAALQTAGVSSRLLTAGLATAYLTDRGIHSESIEDPTDPDRLLLGAAPKILLVGTSENERSFGLKLISAARRKLRTIGFIDAAANAAYRFRGETDNPLAHAPDHLFVPNNHTKAEFVGLGWIPENVLVTGHPHYDNLVVLSDQYSLLDRRTLRGKCFPGIKSQDKVVIFVAEISAGLNNVQYTKSKEYTLIGRGASTGRTQIVLEEFLDSLKLAKTPVYRVLRLHPKNLRSEFESYEGEFDFVSAGGTPYEILQAADLVVGMSSALLEEALFFDNAVLSILPRAIEKQWLPTIEEGIIPCATSRQEIIAEMEFALTRCPSPQKVLPSDFFALGATERVVNHLRRMLAQCSGRLA